MVIETERLELRPLISDDLYSVHSCSGDKEKINT